jgi:predicted nuclease of predicted toxin-antitoxin system
MRILLDESIPERLRHTFSKAFIVETVRYRGWKGLANGDLLSAAEQHFAALVTVDKGLRHQQDVGGRRLGVVVVEADGTKLDDLLPLIPKVETALRDIEPGVVRVVSTL